MYRTVKISVKPKHELYEYCSSITALSKNLYNASLFRVRNIFTAYGKDSLTQLEQEVMDEVALTQNTCGCQIKRVISYNSLEKLMRVTDNPDFFGGLPMQSAQAVVKKAVSDFRNWLASLKAYKNNPSSFLGRPNMPHYAKNEHVTAYLTNQDAVCREGELKLPLTRIRFHLPAVTDGWTLKEVKIKPYYDEYLMLCCFEVPDTEKKEFTHTAAIDLGVDNTAALVTDEGFACLYKGGSIKACNQWYNKEKARLTSVMTKGHETVSVSSRRLTALSKKRDRYLNDQMHKISRSIIDTCVEHGVSTLAIGVNKGIKQRSSMGKQNNQSFTAIPFSRLIFMLKYKAENAGITVIEQEESYTSKADFLNGDYIPVYGRDDDRACFSGSRIKRGLYRSGTGAVINADVNGAANIMRKAGYEIQKDKTKGLLSPKVCIPVKGIGAV